MDNKNSVKKKIELVENKMQEEQLSKGELVNRSMSSNLLQVNNSNMQFHKVKGRISGVYLSYLLKRKNKKIREDIRKFKKVESDIQELDEAVNKKRLEIENIESQIRLQKSDLEDRLSLKSKVISQIKEKNIELQTRKQVYTEHSKVIEREEGSIKTLQHKLSGVNVEIESQEKTKQWQQDYFEKVVNDKQALEGQIANTEKEILTKESELDCLKSNISVIEEENGVLQLNFQKVSQDYNSKSTALEAEVNVFGDEQKKKKDLESQISNFGFEIEECKVNQLKVEKNIATVQSEILTLRTRLNDLILEKNEVTSDLDLLNVELSNKDADRCKLLKDVEDENGHIGRLNLEFEGLIQKRESIESELERLQLEIEDGFNLREDKIQIIKNEELEIASLTNKRDDLLDDTFDLESDLATIDQKIKEKKTILAEKSMALVDEIKNFDDLQELYGDLEVELKNSMELISAKEDEITNTLASNKLKRSENEELQKEIFINKEKIDVLNLEIKQSQDVANELTKGAESLDMSSQQLSLQLEMLYAEKKELEAKISQLNLSIEKESQRNKNIKTEELGLISEIEASKNTLENKLLILEDVNKELSNNKNSLAKFEAEYDKVNSTLEKSNNKIEEQKICQDSLVVKIEDIKSEIEKASNDILLSNKVFLEEERLSQRFSAELLDKKTFLSGEQQRLLSKELEINLLAEQVGVLKSNIEKQNLSIDEIAENILSRTVSIKNMRDEHKKLKLDSESSESQFREKQEELSRLRGLYNSVEKSKLQADKILAKNTAKINEYSFKIEDLKKKISSSEENTSKLEIEEQNDILKNKRRELKSLERAISGEVIGSTFKGRSHNRNDKTISMIYNEVREKYSHSVELSQGLSENAQIELLAMYRKIVRSFNNLAILKIESYNVELTSNVSGLLCNITLNKIADFDDYESEVGGFMKLNPFYTLKSWSETTDSVSFSLVIEKGFLRSGRPSQAQVSF